MGLACQRLDTEFYQPRKPQESPFYQLVEQYYDEFERVYPERYQKKYGLPFPAVTPAFRYALGGLSRLRLGSGGQSSVMPLPNLPLRFASARLTSFGS